MRLSPKPASFSESAWQSESPFKSRRTFAELYCEQHHLARPEFARAVLKKTLHPTAWLLYPLIMLVAPDYFEADLDLVASVGELRSTRDYPVEAARFMYSPSNTGFWRRMFLLRISAGRLRRLLWHTLHPGSSCGDGAL